MTSSNVPVSVVGNEKISAFAEKLNRPLDELVKESKKQNKKQHHSNKPKKNPGKQQQQQKKMENKPNRPANSLVKPDQVRVTIKNDFVARPRARVPSPRIMRRMEDVSYSARPSRIDYGRPVSSSHYIPPPSRQPRIRKP